jgi:hypothetical protein
LGLVVDGIFMTLLDLADAVATFEHRLPLDGDSAAAPTVTLFEAADGCCKVDICGRTNVALSFIWFHVGDKNCKSAAEWSLVVDPTDPSLPLFESA